LKKISIHPGVVVSSTANGNYLFARISKSLPGNPPQQPIQQFHPESNIYGNVDLGPPKVVNAADMKQWKDSKTGLPATPMGTDNLNKLKKAMGASCSTIMLLAFSSFCLEPHAGWKLTIPVQPSSGIKLQVPSSPQNSVGNVGSGPKQPPRAPSMPGGTSPVPSKPIKGK
jgi:hypothetical protein